MIIFWMMRNLLLAFLCFISSNIYPQSHFNKRFEFYQPGWSESAWNVFSLPDGYIIGGGAEYWGNNFLRLGFYKIDFQGNKVFSKVYGDTIACYYLGFPGSIIQLSLDTIIAVGTKKGFILPWVHDQGNLIFLNSNFDTLSTIQFGEKSSPYDTSYIFFQVKSIPIIMLLLLG